MDTRLILSVAATHLKQRKKQTIVAALGVTFGISMYIFMVSFMGGLNDFMDDLTVENTPDIHVFYEAETDRPSIVSKERDGEVIVHHQRPKKEERNIKNGLRIANRIEAMDGIGVVSPSISTQVFISYGSQELNAKLDGIIPDKEAAMYTLSKKVKQGEISDLISGENVIVLGSGIAEKMSIQVGDRVNITSPSGSRLRMKVVALLHTGVMQINNSQIYTSLQTGQKLLGEPESYITNITLRVTDRDNAPILAKELERQFGYNAQDWKEANAAFETGGSIRTMISYGVSITLLIVAGFGIYNILNMTIYEKMRDIAILKAMGFNSQDIVGIFLGQAITIGVMGGLLGLLLGFTIAYSVSNVPFGGGGMFDIPTLPVNFKPQTYIMGFVFGVVTTALAGYLPSRKAGKLDPVAIIRG